MLRFGSLKIPWLRGDRRSNDPYWQFFINTPPADLANTVIQMIREAPEGNVFPTKADMHTPEITSNHVKEMARYLGADLVGVAKLNRENVFHLSDRTNIAPFPRLAGEDEGRGRADDVLDYSFAVICAVRADYDPREAQGIGGQVPVQNGLFITFVLSGWIRELGFRATAKQSCNGEALAAVAGLGKLNSSGRLVTSRYGERVHVADVILTDLPLAPDG